MPSWDDAQYLKFADQRTRAARELLLRVPLARAERVVDLGCGPGNSTALLFERWPSARLVGVDNSATMLVRARQDLPAVEFIEADAASYRPSEPLDLVFANAVLHWLPEHERLLPELLALLQPAGVLAVQMPCNFDEPSHRLMRELPGPWAERVAHVHAKAPVAVPSFYYDVLAPHARYIDIWRTTYEHVMPSAQAIVEWVKATGFRPYLDAVASSDRAAYVAAYTEAIDAAYPPRADGQRLFSFPRLFVVAMR